MAGRSIHLVKPTGPSKVDEMEDERPVTFRGIAWAIWFTALGTTIVVLLWKLSQR